MVKILKACQLGAKKFTSFICVLFVLLSGEIFANPTGVVTLQWDDVPNAVGYAIEIAKDSGFKSILVKEKTSKNEYDWVNPTAGVYFYHVAAIAAGDVVSAFSEPSRIVVSLSASRPISPGQNAKINKASGDTIVTFKWEVPAGMAKTDLFKLEIAKSATFKSIVFSRTLSAAEIAVSLKESGVFFWRVLVGKAGFGDAQPSKTFSFLIENQNLPLQALAPQPGWALEQKSEEENVVFRWQGPATIKQYRLVISKKSSVFRRIVYSESFSGDVFTASVPLKVGEYFWRVEANRKTPEAFEMTADQVFSIGAKSH